ncbi:MULTISPECIES: ABC transporter permease [unclassified Rhizobium]|jgi:putative spermidine/putrescine transport system permease protein|uniref:ABC transporter permease n=1 Tax=unclassified Rhizobium TaxID=2613769 RepID=UPI000A94D4B2|nr:MULTISPECIES: ABC transporter permease [unclassified Rhizobium]
MMEAVIDNRASEGRKTTTAPINIAVWLLLPSTVLLLGTFLYPLFSIAMRSFTDPEFGLQNYASLLTDDISIVIILRTVRIAAIVAVVTLFIGFPYAYTLTLVTPRTRAVLMTIALLPFWTSAIARSFAWTLLMQRGGLIETAFSWIGLPGVVLIRTSTGVTIAMAQVLLPYMILPLYSNMRGIDRRLLDAAASMGSPRWRAFLEIYLPLSLPGMLAGLSLVFVISLGFYVTPAILGSPQEALVSQLIATRVDTLLDFGGAGALAVIVLLVAAALMTLIGRLNARLDLQPNMAGK